MRIFNLFDPLSRRIALLIGIALLPIVVYDLILAYRGYAEAEQRAWDSVRQLSIAASNSQNALIEGTRRLLITLAELPTVRAATAAASPDCGETMQRIVGAFPEYKNISLIDPEGRTVCSAAKTAFAADLSQTPWFAEIRDSRAFTLGYFTLGEKHDTPVIMAGLAIGRPGGDFVGALIVDISLPWLGSLAHQHGLPADGVVYLLDSRGTVMTTSDRFAATDEPAQGIPDTYHAVADAALPSETLLHAVAEKKLTEFIDRDKGGTKRLFSAAALGNDQLFILYGLPWSSALSWSNRQAVLLVLGPIVMLLLAMITAMIGGELLIARGVRSLSTLVDAYSQGVAMAPKPVNRGARELRQFASAFATMAERVSAREIDLRRSVEEKNVLLREVHHRVKNNLQIVTSFLNLQAKRAKEEGARIVLSEARARVRALALVHRYLYESPDIGHVDFAAFIAGLCTQLEEIHGLSERDIALHLDLQPVQIPANRAVAVALFITEALTNAMRHGFPDNRSGNIWLTLACDADGNDPISATLSIVDDGIELSDGPDQPPHGVGRALMDAFARQLGADLVIESKTGVAVTLRFIVEPAGAAEAESVAPDPDVENKGMPG